MKQEKAAKDREKTARGLFSSGFSVVFFCILTPGKIIVVGLKIAVIQFILVSRSYRRMCNHLKKSII